MFTRGIELKTWSQILTMRDSGLVTSGALARMRAAAQPGVTTKDVENVGREHLRQRGAESNFLDYGAEQEAGGFPAVACISVNDEVVHGIPGPRTLVSGDVVSIDFGAIVGGWHSDSAITFELGEPDGRKRELLNVTEAALWRGISAARLGGRVGDISAAIGSYVDDDGQFQIMQGYTGHGIGIQMHQPPDVPNRGKAGRGPRIVPGLVLAVEPMLTAGSGQTQVLPDGWTVATADGSIGAHFEHTITVTETGIWVLTADDGGASKLAELGVAYGGPGS